MKALVTLVHPDRNSFCGQLADNIAAALGEGGHHVEIADLYGEKFQPTLTVEDFAQFENRPMPEDVLKEQARVEWADGLIFVMPIWWYQFPAMFKGWIDRVFSEHWAYEFSTAFDRNKSLLGSRKVLIVATAGGSPRTFEKYEYDRGMDTLWNRGVWGYCGFRDVHTHFFYKVSPKEMPEAVREEHMAEARRIGRDFFAAPVLVG